MKEITQYIDIEGENRHKEVCHVVRSLVSTYADIPDDQFIVKEVQGGVTNKLYNCAPPQSHGVLVRIYGKQSEILIDRDGELKNLVYIYKNGFAPKFHGFFKNGFVYGFFPGRDLTPQDLQNGNFAEEISRQIALWHQQEIPSAPHQPSFFLKLNSWMDLVPKKYEDPVKRRKFEEISKRWDLKGEVENLRLFLEEAHSPIVFAHNDLIGKNIIYDDTTDEIHFIDYEYGAYNYRAFDLANHFCEFAGFELDYTKYPQKEQQYQYFRTYFSTFYGRDATDQELHDMQIEISRFSLGSHFFWATWGLVQAHISDIDFDFMQYAMDRYSQYFARKAEILAME